MPIRSIEIPPVVAQRGAERFELDASGCWVSGFPVKSNGYAGIWAVGEDGRHHSYLAHRAAWTHANGPIPQHMVVDHTCHNRRCVNPEHLRVLTREENARRHLGTPDFPLGQCPNGHPLSEQRKRMKGVTAGYGYCGACQKIRNAALTERRRQERSNAVTDGETND